MNHLQDFLFDVVVVGPLNQLSELLHKLLGGNFLVNERATILDARLHDLTKRERKGEKIEAVLLPSEALKLTCNEKS